MNGAQVLEAPESELSLASATAAGMPWQRWLAAGLSLGLLIALGAVMKQQGLDRLRGALPANPGFWLAFVAYYFALPVSEWVIYRRIWNLPPGGFVALLRKLVSNEMLLGYSGELSFYLYARRETGLTSSPFKTIKDVSILSAMAGNLATLGMVALAYPIWHDWGTRLLPSGTGLSLALLLGLSLVLLTLRRQIFSLPAPQLGFIASVHVVRVMTATALLGLMWAAALPDVPVQLWIGLAALQLVVMRLPLIPNKEIVFAGSAMLIVGEHSAIASLMALVASLTVAMHLVVGLTLLARELLKGSTEA